MFEGLKNLNLNYTLLAMALLLIVLLGSEMIIRVKIRKILVFLH